MENRQELKDAVKNLIVKKLAEDILEQEMEKFESLKRELSSELTRIKEEPLKPGEVAPMIPQTESEKKMHHMFGFFYKDEFAKSFKARLEGMRMMKRASESKPVFSQDTTSPFSSDSSELNDEISKPIVSIDKLRDILSKAKFDKFTMNDIDSPITNYDSLPPSADTVMHEYKPEPFTPNETPTFDELIPVSTEEEFKLNTKKRLKKPTLKKITKKVVKKPTKKVTAGNKPKKKK